VEKVFEVELVLLQQVAFLLLRLIKVLNLGKQALKLSGESNYVIGDLHADELVLGVYQHYRVARTIKRKLLNVAILSLATMKGGYRFLNKLSIRFVA